MASYRLAVRHDTAANWTSADPVLAQGEFGYETDTGKIKIGDSATSWASLSYFADEISNDYVDSHLNTDSASTGDFLSWDGSDYVWTVPNSGGAQTFTDLTATASFTSPGIDDNATTTQLTIEDGSSVFNNDTKVSRAHRYGTAFSVENTSTGGKAWELRSTGVDNLLGTGDLQFNVDSNSSLTLKADRSAEFSGDLTASGNFTSKGIDDNATSTAITIDANENVGIGSTTPKAALDIIDSSAARVYLGTSASNYGGLVYSNGVMSMRGIGNGSAAVVSADATNSEITFTTAGVADRMVIDAAGTTTVTGGFLAAQPGAGSNAFAAGSGSGATGQQRSCVAIGYQAGQTNQQDYAVAMGHLTASLGQGVRATALGILAGYDTQGAYAVSVGASTGSVRQGSYGVGVGHQAGKTDQGDHAIAIGRDVGFTNQGASSIAIGRGAGYSVQGANSIAIGENAQCSSSFHD